MQVVQFIGKVQYVVEQYNELKFIQIPVSRSELLFISTEADSDHHAIVEYVLENITNIHDTLIDVLPLPEYNKKSYAISHLNGNFPPIVDYNDVCSKIYNINGVMFANFYDLNSCALTDVPSNNKRGNNNIMGAEVMRISIMNAWRVWKSRKRFEDKIGGGKFAFAEYGAVKRLSVPLPEDVLLFVIIYKNADPLKVLSEIKAASLAIKTACTLLASSSSNSISRWNLSIITDSLIRSITSPLMNSSLPLVAMFDNLVKRPRRKDEYKII